MSPIETGTTLPVTVNLPFASLVVLSRPAQLMALTPPVLQPRASITCCRYLQSAFQSQSLSELSHLHAKTLADDSPSCARSRGLQHGFESAWGKWKIQGQHGVKNLSLFLCRLGPVNFRRNLLQANRIHRGADCVHITCI